MLVVAGLASVLACASFEWRVAVIALVIAITCIAALGAVPPTQTSQVIELRGDRLGVLFRGERVQASADYFGVELGTLRFEVVSGLTKSEHRRLQDLFEHTLPGERSDVPTAIQTLRT